MNRWFKHHQAIGRRKLRISLDIYKSDKLTGHPRTPGSSENNWRLRSARSGVIVISTPSTGHSILGGRYNVTISQHHELSPDCDSRAFVFVGVAAEVSGVREGVPMTHEGAGRLHCLAPHSDTDMSPSSSVPGLDPRNTCGKWTYWHPAFCPYPRSSNRILRRNKAELDTIKQRPWWLTLGRRPDSRAAPVSVT